MRPYERDPAAIYRQSFETVRGEARLERFDAGMERMAVRLIHACGMVDVADRIAFSADAYTAGHAALAGGAPILCDCEMVGAGIIRPRLLSGGPTGLTGPSWRLGTRRPRCSTFWKSWIRGGRNRL
jgi:precorrin isomerase